MIGLSLLRVAALSVALGGLAACAPTNVSEVLSSKGAVELRAMQTRAFDTTDRAKTVRTVIATLQDLGYTLNKVEMGAGTVSATKLGQLNMTVAVVPRGAKQMAVRANAAVFGAMRNTQVDDPAFYQTLFFDPLAKAMFLTALQVEDGPEPPSLTLPEAVRTTTRAAPADSNSPKP